MCVYKTEEKNRKLPLIFLFQINDNAAPEIHRRFEFNLGPTFALFSSPFNDGVPTTLFGVITRSIIVLGIVTLIIFRNTQNR